MLYLSVIQCIFDEGHPLLAGIDSFFFAQHCSLPNQDSIPMLMYLTIVLPLYRKLHIIYQQGLCHDMNDITIT